MMVVSVDRMLPMSCQENNTLCTKKKSPLQRLVLMQLVVFQGVWRSCFCRKIPEYFLVFLRLTDAE